MAVSREKAGPKKQELHHVFPKFKLTTEKRDPANKVSGVVPKRRDTKKRDTEHIALDLKRANTIEGMKEILAKTKNSRIR